MSWWKASLGPLAALILLTGFFSACQKTAKKSPPIPISEETPSTGSAAQPVVPVGPPLEIPVPTENSGKTRITLKAQQLTSSGENTDARFSTDGKRILFVSRSRSGHHQAQIYELHLGAMREKRITFHDGDDASPVYATDGVHIFFSSSTDEIKEEPHVSDRLLRTYRPEVFAKRHASRAEAKDSDEEGSEIYEQTLHGRSIERLTHSPGFDGDVEPDPSSKNIVFSSARTKKTTRLFVAKGKSQTALSQGDFVDRFPRISQNGKWLIWSRKAVGGEDMHLMIMENGKSNRPPRALTSGSSLDLHPAWHPSGEIAVFASNRDDRVFNLYTIDREGRCLKRLTQSEFDLLQPVFNPDGKQIIFTARRGDQHQLFVLDYKPPADCIGDPVKTGPSPGVPILPAPSSGEGKK